MREPVLPAEGAQQPGGAAAAGRTRPSPRGDGRWADGGGRGSASSRESSASQERPCGCGQSARQVKVFSTK